MWSQLILQDFEAKKIEEILCQFEQFGDSRTVAGEDEGGRG